MSLKVINLVNLNLTIIQEYSVSHVNVLGEDYYILLPKEVRITINYSTPFYII